MRFGGLQKHSLIDFPARVSCVCFVSGCNFRCPYCHNPDLVMGKPSTTLDEDLFYEFLEGRRGLLDGVVISGGEPTLEEGLPTLCGKIRAMGYEVKLDTNGSRPGVIRELMEKGLVDYIAMDLKTAPEGYGVFMKGSCRVEDILESIGVILGGSVPYEFRTTCVRPLVGPEVMENLARTIEGARLYVLQPFHRAQILDPGFFRGIEPGFTAEEMNTLRAVAEPFVGECRLR